MRTYLPEEAQAKIAAENVAVQIEAINWMTVEGFSIALCALIAQNFGAKNYEKDKPGPLKVRAFRSAQEIMHTQVHRGLLV